MLRFLPGIVLVQLITAASLYAFLKTPMSRELQWTLLGLGVLFGVLVALWFASISSHTYKDKLSRVMEEHARERENLRVKAEQQKLKIVRSAQREFSKEANRVNAKANFKVGAAFAGVAALGAAMLFTQFVTAGVLVLSVAGGGVAGYLVRRRQEIALRQKLSLPEKSAGKANRGAGKNMPEKNA